MAVFAYVADRIKGEARPVSVRSVAAAAELSRRQVQNSLRKLCDRGYLSAQERTGAATVYTQHLLHYGSRQKDKEQLQREYAAAIEYLSEDENKGKEVSA
jgi:DNA-binding transcriptional MocR family regulator